MYKQILAVLMLVTLLFSLSQAQDMPAKNMNQCCVNKDSTSHSMQMNHHDSCAVDSCAAHNNMKDMKEMKPMHGMKNHETMKEMKSGAVGSSSKIWNKYCPVKGGEVDPEAPTVEYMGKTIGFCCPGCDKKFSANPEKYIENLSEDGQTFHKKS